MPRGKPPPSAALPPPRERGGISEAPSQNHPLAHAGLHILDRILGPAGDLLGDLLAPGIAATALGKTDRADHRHRQARPGAIEREPEAAVTAGSDTAGWGLLGAAAGGRRGVGPAGAGRVGIREETAFDDWVKCRSGLPQLLVAIKGDIRDQDFPERFYREVGAIVLDEIDDPVARRRATKRLEAFAATSGIHSSQEQNNG